MNKHTAELLEKHFDIAFTAPNGIKKLRELILTLAMQGRLIPQNPNDQPASELLQEIEAEKQRLVQEGKIKQPKPLLPVAEQEKPYVLPQGWEWVRLGDIGVWKSGSTPSRSNSAFYGGNIPWVKSGEVKQGRIRTTEETITQAALDKCSLHINDKGSVLVAMYGANIGEVGILEIEAATNQAVCACKTYTSFDESYLLYLITSLKPYFINQGAGAAQPNISREKIIATVFPLPPFGEQSRIVAKIDELMARCDKLEKLRTEQQEKRLTVHAAAIKQLLNIAEPDQHQRAQTFLAKHFDELYIVKENVTELRKAILQLAVMGKLVPQNPDDQPASELLKEIEAEKQQLVKEGKSKKPKPLLPVTEEEKPYALPQGWEWVRLGSILAFEYGDNLPQSKRTNSGEFPVYGSNGIVGTHNIAFLYGSCIVIGRKGSAGALNLCLTEGCCVTDVAFYCTPPKEIDLYFCFQLFHTLRLDSLGKGIKPGLNRNEAYDLVIAIPPLKEQQRIVAEIDQLMSLCDSLDQQIDAATSKQTELLNALVYAQSLDAPENQQPIAEMSGQKSEVIDLTSYRAAIGCYALNKLANAQYFGRTAAAKVMYLAQAHIGLALDLHPERKAAGPLDKWIYGFERLGLENGWFEVQEIMLTSGRKKAEYRCLPALSVPVTKAESLMSPAQQAEFDRLIYAIAGKTTEQVEIIATLFAVWNDFLLDGIQPTDEQIIREMRENWHERKARFSPSELAQWLDWLRKEQFIPKGQGPRTIQQHNLCNSG